MPLIHEKIIAIQQEIEAIEKHKSNEEGGVKYKFRGIDDLYNAIHPLHKKHGVFIVPEVFNTMREERLSKSGGTLLWALTDVKYKFYAQDGSFIEATVRGEAMDSSDKATNKSMSAALKYALMQIYLIPTEDLQDADKGSPAGSIKKIPAAELEIIEIALGTCIDKKEVLSLLNMYPQYKNDPDFQKLFNTRKGQLVNDGLWN